MSLRGLCPSFTAALKIGLLVFSASHSDGGTEHVTAIATDTTISTTIRTDVTTETPVVTNVQTVIRTTTVRPVLIPRQLTSSSSPNQIPAYASACANASMYSSACSCIGVTASTTIVMAPVATTTLTFSTTATAEASTLITVTIPTTVQATTTLISTYTQPDLSRETSFFLDAASGGDYTPIDLLASTEYQLVIRVHRRSTNHFYLDPNQSGLLYNIVNGTQHFHNCPNDNPQISNAACMYPISQLDPRHLRCHIVDLNHLTCVCAATNAPVYFANAPGFSTSPEYRRQLVVGVNPNPGGQEALDMIIHL
jgi:hypothetical protein